MRNYRMKAFALLAGSSLLCSSCIGSFGLWTGLRDWNQGVGNKFVNEVVFCAFHIIPIYEVAYVADLLVLNSIEFWSGSNPVAQVGQIQRLKGENGDYVVRTNVDGYTITKVGEEDRPLDLVYNAATRTWNAVAGSSVYEVFTMNEDGTITFKQQDGTPVTISPTEEGLAMAQHALSGPRLSAPSR